MTLTSNIPVRPITHAITLASVVGLVVANVGLSALAAVSDLSPLKGILLDSSSVETRIVLQSTDTIPYKVVSKSADSIVLDLTVNGASDSVQTDFAQAKNIEQVILKPVNSQQLRVIIRGEHLADPIVLLPQAEALKKSQQALKEVIAPRVTDAKTSADMKKAAVKTTDATDKTLATADKALDADLADANKAGADADPALADMDAETPLDLEAADKAGSDRTAIGALPSTQEQGLIKGDDEDESDSPLDSIFSMIGDTLSGIINLSWGGLLKLLVIVSAALVFFQWVRRRPQGKRRLGSIDAAGSESVWSQLGGLFGSSEPAPKRQAPQRELQSHQRPVGLRGLEDLTTPAYTNGQSSPALRQHQGLAQYSQQAQSPLLEEPTLRNREIIDRELDRSLTRRQAMDDFYQRTAPKPAVPTKPAAAPVRPKSTIPAKNNTQRPATPSAATRRPVAPQQPLEPQRQRDYQDPQRRQSPAARGGIQPAHFERLDRSTNRVNQAARVSNQSSLGRVANHGGRFGTAQQQPARRPMQAPMNAERPVLNRQNPAQQSAPKAAQPSGQWDLKHNTNVLDFLRDVADLVEKEGNAPAARGLKKGLASTNPN